VNKLRIAVRSSHRDIHPRLLGISRLRSDGDDRRISLELEGKASHENRRSNIATLFWSIIEAFQRNGQFGSERIQEAGPYT